MLSRMLLALKKKIAFIIAQKEIMW